MSTNPTALGRETLQPTLRVTLDVGGDSRMANLWIADDEGGYRIQLPHRLANSLLTLINGQAS